MPFTPSLLSLLPLVLVLLTGLVPLFPLLYVIIRWRVPGGGAVGLGFRSGLLYLRSAGLLVMVTGGALLLHGLVVVDSDTRSMEDLRRIGGGLALGGAVFWALNGMLVRSLPDVVGAADATRVFNGFVMLFAGVAAFVALGGLCVLALQRDAELDDLRAPLVWVVVWTATWLIHLLLLRTHPGD